MSTGEKAGLVAAVEAVGVGEGPVSGAPAEQVSLPLGPSSSADDGGELALFDAFEARSAKGGRPKGSRNRKTDEWVNYILSRYRSPLTMLAETMCRNVRDLANELGCDVEKAFDMQLEAAKALAPYVHQKLPTAIQVDGAAGIQLILATSATVQQAVGATDQELEDGTRILEALVSAPSEAEDESEENQGLDGLRVGELDGDELDGERQAVGNAKERASVPTDLKSGANGHSEGHG